MAKLTHMKTRKQPAKKPAKRPAIKRKSFLLKPYIWTVQISDGYCTYEYKLEDRKGNKSIQDVYEAVRRELSAEPSKGRFVWPSE